MAAKMTLLAPMFYVFVFCSILHTVSSTTHCLECRDMAHPQDCNIVTSCTDYEICYVEQVVTSGGLVLYNSGCLAKNRCNTAGKRDLMVTSQYLAEQRRHRNIRSIHKRQDEVSSTDIPTCVACCHGPYCNIEGCGQKAEPMGNRGPICFSCQDQLDPESCRSVERCYQGQVCMVRKLDIYSDVWATGCIGDRQCRVLVQVEQLAEAQLVGRRRDVVEVNKCPRCCADDFCNHSCRQNFTITSPATSTMYIPTHSTTTTTTTTPRPTTTTPKPTTTLPTTTVPTTTTSTTPKPTTTVPTTTVPTTTVPTTTTSTTPKPTTTVPTTTSTTPTTTVTTTTVTTTTSTTPKPTTTVPTTTSSTTQRTTPTTTTQTTTQTTTTQRTTTVVSATSTHASTTTASTTHAPTTTAPTTHAPTTTTVTTTTPKPTVDPKVACEADGYVYHAHLNLCLLFYTQPLMNWTDAREFCHSKQGILVVKGNGPEKMKDVLQIYDSENFTVPMWVGATSVGESVIYIWGDGTRETIDPTVNKDLTSAQCLYLTSGSYHSSDVCSKEHAFICERLQSGRT